jgi:hypothetical protein
MGGRGQVRIRWRLVVATAAGLSLALAIVGFAMLPTYGKKVAMLWALRGLSAVAVEGSAKVAYQGECIPGGSLSAGENEVDQTYGKNEFYVSCGVDEGWDPVGGFLILNRNCPYDVKIVCQTLETGGIKCSIAEYPRSWSLPWILHRCQGETHLEEKLLCRNRGHSLRKLPTVNMPVCAREDLRDR